MQKALELADLAAKEQEVPVGAVVVKGQSIIGAAGNAPITLNDPTAHAEILALRQAAQKLKNYRLDQATLYVTLEPCPMCVGAMIHARISRVVFGATDPKTGALISQYHMGRDNRANHSIEVTGGVLGDECAQLLQDFFRARRK